MAINRTSPKKGKVVDIPDAPTIGTATAGAAQVSVAFTPATTGGPVSSYTVLSNPDSVTKTGTSSPIAVTGVTPGTAYTFTVRANNASGSSPYGTTSSNSATPTAFNVEALIVAGGGGSNHVGAGGAGGYRYFSALSLTPGTGFTVTVGAGANGNGSNSVLGTLSATGGGGNSGFNGASGGSGGGASSNGGGGGSGNAGGYTPPEGYNGGAGGSFKGGGGGGSAGAGGGANNAESGPGGGGGSGTANSITGTSVTYATGGQGGGPFGASGGGNGGANTGNGGAGNNGSSQGGSGIVIIAYPDSAPAITSIGAGLTYTQPTRSGYRVYRFTGGTGTVTI